jgi:hypothetical protein
MLSGTIIAMMSRISSLIMKLKYEMTFSKMSIGVTLNEYLERSP